ncbi:UNVERIFIED_CONTAM: hypothetical protein GTU68_067527 [Idotea baltica]|nr:hypothetical protein [Idotea baltica]
MMPSNFYCMIYPI